MCIRDSINAEYGGRTKAMSQSVCCPAGHKVVPNEQVGGTVTKADGTIIERQFPPIRQYGACDICDSRGTSHRCVLNCDYDMCAGCYHTATQELSRPDLQD
eukprot:TRINITY_DN3717_c0_g1_i3.p2 TRINITY_DN3717_c0_g1~~TRINITY_DN3717_c0_g1_i3.p2  ORF type:complete len:101 (-),score=16.33 TRINITY_DN3717_c0_g1_i3:430-732(-)